MQLVRHTCLHFLVHVEQLYILCAPAVDVHSDHYRVTERHDVYWKDADLNLSFEYLLLENVLIP